jgi:CrcB protein
MKEALLKIWWVGLGGFLGANARYWLGVWFEGRSRGPFPWATFAINVSGSFLLGLFMVLALERGVLPRAPVLRLLFAVGFLGAYTTFSTFTYETLVLAETGSPGRAFANVAGSVAAGLLAAWLGLAVGRRF